MTRQEALAELQIIRANVEMLMISIKGDGSLSQKWRNEKLCMYERRVEALTFAIEELEDGVGRAKQDPLADL